MIKTHRIFRLKKSPVICHVPHASIRIPRAYRSDYLLPKENLEVEAISMADLYADELFSDLLDEFGAITATLSRLVVDMERLADDKEEPMEKRAGMGVLYTRTQNGELLRDISPVKRIKYMMLYENYHDAFAKLVSECLDKFDKCLILDCHTFPSRRRQYEEDQRMPRPDVCIGTDNYHTPVLLKQSLTKSFAAQGYTVKNNSPYSGTIVPLQYLEKDSRVQSIMIEINRSLYMNERTFKKRKDFERVSRRFCEIIKGAISACGPGTKPINA